MARDLIGRDEELDAIVRLLDDPAGLPGTAALCGEAGVGKTTLWLAGLDAAGARGYRVLSARPSDAETRLAFSGLADLLDRAVDSVLPELPAIQRRSLEAALLLGTPGFRVDERAISAAFLGALRVLASGGPVLVAVDDVQWLDAESAVALRYALARLESEPVVCLLSVRGLLPDWLRRAVPIERMHAVDVVGLSVGATFELLRTRLGATFARPTLIRIWEASRGNPFFALELATALVRRGGSVPPGDELPIPSDLDELLHARLRGLSAQAIDVARSVAALADPTILLVEAAFGSGIDAGLAEALETRVLERDAQRLRFTHPLLASAVTTRQSPASRRQLHQRLADIVPSQEERARHLALATAEPDEQVAATLESAAQAALRSGAPGAAAELADEALRLTPSTAPGDVRRRLLFAADRHAQAGDPDRAGALLDAALASSGTAKERATVLVHMADVDLAPSRSIPLYREALAETGDDLALLATIHLGLATRMRWSDGAEAAFEQAVLAVAAASRAGDDALRSRALAVYGDLHFRTGRGIPLAESEEALALERRLSGSLGGSATWSYLDQLSWTADVEGALRFARDVRDAIAAGNEPDAQATTSWFIAFNSWRAGRWEEADRYAAESVELHTQLGRLLPPHEIPSVAIAAHRGRLDQARARARDAYTRAEAAEIRIAQSVYGWVLGFVELSLGNMPAALEHLRSAYEVRNAFMLEPAARLELGDLLEALVASGEPDAAEEIIATWDERARRLDRAWALAILARGRGLVLAARGDLDGAFASFDEALAEHARSTDPFHRARTLLARGRTERRAKRRAAARSTLTAALAEFERLGAPLWADQTRAELARIGGRAPASDTLTEAERRIAELVASGRTNREVAAALFLTVRSVETALTRVYSKLGVRSRTELASRYPSKT
jgi:DNA-binding CsgD family transcriptional regulator